MVITWVCFKNWFTKSLGCLIYQLILRVPRALMAFNQWLLCGLNVPEKWESLGIISHTNKLKKMKPRTSNTHIYIYIMCVCVIYIIYIYILIVWIPMISSSTQPSAWRISRSSLVHSQPNRLRLSGAPSLGRGTAPWVQNVKKNRGW